MGKPLDPKNSLAGIGRDLKRYGKILLGSVVLLFILEVVSWVAPIDQFGVHPRESAGLIGVLTHPFLHSGLGHVTGNSVAILMFGAMIVIKEEIDLYVTVLLSMLVGGFGIWLFGQTGSNHIGASGVVFGLFGYLLSTGWFERKFWPMLLSIFVLFTWGAMIFGVLPGQRGISWEGHLFGFLGGVLSAFALAKIRRRRDAAEKDPLKQKKAKPSAS